MKGRDRSDSKIQRDWGRETHRARERERERERRLYRAVAEQRAGKRRPIAPHRVHLNERQGEERERE